MGTITTNDGTTIFYKDWARPTHCSGNGGIVIVHDRRGHERSTRTWDGNDMDTYAYDLAQLTEKLDLREAIHVGALDRRRGKAWVETLLSETKRDC